MESLLYKFVSILVLNSIIRFFLVGGRYWLKKIYSHLIFMSKYNISDTIVTPFCVGRLYSDLKCMLISQEDTPIKAAYLSTILV